MNRFAFALALGFSLNCLAQDDPSSRQLQKVKELQARQIANRQPASNRPSPDVSAFPPNDVRLPYIGKGELIIFNDGMLLVGIRGASTWDDSTGQMTARTVLLPFSVDTSELAIVNHSGEVYLDRDGAESMQRKIDPRESEISRFATEESASGTNGRELLHMAGSVSLSLDQSQNVINLAATDSKKALHFNMVAQFGPAQTGEVGGTAGLVAQNRLQVIYDPSVVFASGCNACCGSQGQYCCSINCNGKCSAGCHGDNPFCDCISMEDGPSP